MAEKPTKKVVRVEADPAAAHSDPTWKPTPESKGKATTFRIIAVALWLIAIGGEAFAIFWVLKQNPVNLILLIGILVGIAVFAIGGSLLWKRANRFDPASTANPVRFFVQNQLGAIITVIAFLPLIILIFLDKNMHGKQKGIAGAIAIVLLLVAGYFGVSTNPPSVEQYVAETQVVVGYTGADLVFWTKSGNVYHLCEAASAVNQESQDNTIYSGTVVAAHEAGKDRLTLQVDQELAQCGLDGGSSQ